MGCMGLVCGWGLLTGRLWFLVEGLDQGANSRRRIQSLRFLQEAERPVGLVALDGVEGDEKELSTLREGQTGDWKGAARWRRLRCIRDSAPPGTHGRAEGGITARGVTDVNTA